MLRYFHDPPIALLVPQWGGGGGVSDSNPTRGHGTFERLVAVRGRFPAADTSSCVCRVDVRKLPRLTGKMATPLGQDALQVHHPPKSRKRPFSGGHAGMGDQWQNKVSFL